MESERIIELNAYSTVVMANLAKTKLDSYGIPCFLTDENFVNLYPGIQNDIFPGVRLYVLKQDHDRAIEVLKEDGMSS